MTGITPVTLVTPGAGGDLPKVGTLVTFTGWGSPEETAADDYAEKASTDQLKQAQVPLIADRVCRATYTKNKDQMEDAQLPNMKVSLCTGTAAGIGHCHGDSGGPLFTTDGDQVVQIGVVSWSPGCGDPRFPSVYARLDNSSINDFIRGAIGALG